MKITFSSIVFCSALSILFSLPTFAARRVKTKTTTSTVRLSTSTQATVTLTTLNNPASEIGPTLGSFLLRRTGATDRNLTVNLSVRGTAVNGTDYKTVRTSITIPKGAASSTVHVIPIGDGLVEGDETVNLLIASGSYTRGSEYSAIMTISDAGAVATATPVPTEPPVSTSTPITSPTLVPTSPIPTHTPTSPPSVSAIPEKVGWESMMVQQLAKYCVEADIKASIGSAGVTSEAAVWYYDGAWNYYKAAVYTGNPDWNRCGDYAVTAYRDWVLSVSKGVSWPVGALNGWRIFPHGLLAHYRRTGDPLSREAILRLSKYSAYAGVGGSAHCGESRETAYIIQAYLAAEKVGEPRNPLLITAINNALGHLDGWFQNRSCNYMQPFMVGLTMHALTEAYAATGDIRIPAKIQMAADALWTAAWNSTAQGFVYDMNLDGSYRGGTTTALNALIAPAYAWLWQLNGAERNLARGDEAFGGAIRFPEIYTGKQVSQHYRSSFDFVKWRSSPAGTFGYPASYFP